MAFQRINQSTIPALQLTVETYQHPTGAQHVHLASDDPHNVFMVAFLTVPEDSTGVAHILEHTALCGSQRYPVRDPFFMMLRRSLNTFMNAFTSNDWTAYPFASQNKKDFNNLLDVYLDAAFFPLLDEMDFAQEGHRLDFDDKDQLVFKGVVFNEMKGALSSPLQRLYQAAQSQVFPTTTYHHNSGGDPQAITDLTWQQLKDFHASHYQPGNAVFLTYGNIPAQEHQQRFEQRVLDHFDQNQPGLRLAVDKEQRYKQPQRHQAPYPADNDDGPCHQIMAWLLGDSTDALESLQGHILSEVLLNNSSSPLRHALETTDLGSSPSPLCGFDGSSTRETLFFCGLEGCKRDDAVGLEQLVTQVLQQIVDEGIDPAIVETALHQLELSQREISAGSYPYGLQLILEALPGALHGGEPADFLDLDSRLEKLRHQCKKPEFIPELIKKWLLNNPHRVTVTLYPDSQLAVRENQAERDKLQQIQQQLSDSEAQKIRQQAQALAQRQNEHTDTSCLPKVGLDDVPTELNLPQAHVETINGHTVYWYEQGTNGLTYLQWFARLPQLNDELLALLPLYTRCVTEVGLGDQGYQQIQARQAAHTGGLHARSIHRGDVDQLDNSHHFLVLAGKALQRNQQQLLELLLETSDQARFDEQQRLGDLLRQWRNQRLEHVTDVGHQLAMSAAAAGVSPLAQLLDNWNGLTGLNHLTDLAARTDLQSLSQQLTQLHEEWQQAEKSLLVVCEAQTKDGLRQLLQQRLPQANHGSTTGFQPSKQLTDSHRLWEIPTAVNFCASAFRAVPLNHPDAAALNVLAPYLRNGFLHRRIREQGGAYGGGASFDGDSATFRFFSYRDPRLQETLADFRAAVDWINQGPVDEQALEEAILSTIAALDKPGSPAGEAIASHFAGLCGRDAKQRRDYRQRILAVTGGDLQRVASQYLQASQASLAVLTSPDHQQSSQDWTQHRLQHG